MNFTSMIVTMKGELAFKYALWRMGKLPAELVPDVACDALEEGLDHPALRYLAGLRDPTLAEIGTKFDDACRQLGVVPATPDDVQTAEFRIWLEEAIPIASMIAMRILNGTLDPAEGWLNIPWRDGPLGPLGIFFTFADREGGTVSFDENFRQQLNVACRQFLAEVRPEKPSH